MSTTYYAWIGYGVCLGHMKDPGCWGIFDHPDDADSSVGRRMVIRDNNDGYQYLLLADTYQDSSLYTDPKTYNGPFKGTYEIPLKEKERILNGLKILGIEHAIECKWHLEVGSF